MHKKKMLSICLPLAISYSSINPAMAQLDPIENLYSSQSVLGQPAYEPISLSLTQKVEPEKKVLMYGNDADEVNLELKLAENEDGRTLGGITYYINTNGGDDFVRLSTTQDNPESLSPTNISIDSGSGHDKVALKIYDSSANLNTGSGDDKVFILGKGEVDIFLDHGNDSVVLYQVEGRTTIHFQPEKKGQKEIFGRSSFSLDLGDSSIEDFTLFRYLNNEEVNTSGLKLKEEYDESALSSTVYLFHNISADDFYQKMLEANNLVNYQPNPDSPITLSDKLFDAVDADYFKIENIYNISSIKITNSGTISKELIDVKSKRDSKLVVEIDHDVKGFAYVDEKRGNDSNNTLIGDGYKNRFHLTSGKDEIYGVESKDIYEVYPETNGETTIIDGRGESLIVFNNGIHPEQLSYRVYKSDLYIKVTDSQIIKIKDWLFEKHLRHNGGKYTFYFRDTNELVTQDDLDRSLNLDVNWILLKEAIPNQKTLKMKMERKDRWKGREEEYLRPETTSEDFGLL